MREYVVYVHHNTMLISEKCIQLLLRMGFVNPLVCDRVFTVACDSIFPVSRVGARRVARTVQIGTRGGRSIAIYVQA